MNTKIIKHHFNTGGTCEKITIPLLLIIAVLITYRQVFSFGFINYDTPLYVTENLKVLAGITPENIKWALTTNFFSNWHPLTWLSHMLDVDIWGINPSGHHTTSLILHIFNSLLIFIIFNKTTAKTWESAILAGLFALHPLHIESVAWVAERKDVLSTFFFLLSILCYVYYVRVQNIARYTMVLLTFSLALMSKPMVVTFPFVLLLLDHWPLGRCNLASDPETQQGQITSNAILSILLEKIPFFLLAAISSWFTLFAQKTSMVDLGNLTFSMRLANACTSYLDYIAKTFWPVKLSILYPHQGMPSLIKILTAICIITSVSFLCVKWWRTRPWLLSGWLWFLGTLVPVIGIVHVGHQAMADRYTYIPHIGFFLIILWGASTAFRHYHVPKRIVFCIAIASIMGCSIMTQYQLRYWQNDGTLFARAIVVTGDNYIAETNLGTYLLSVNKLDKAEKHLSRAIQINPRFYIAYTNLGRVYSLKGKSREAIESYRISLELNPYGIDTSFVSHFASATEFEKIGSPMDAIFHYKKAIEIKPNSVPAYINTGKLLKKINKPDEALLFFQNAHLLDPKNMTVRKEIDEIRK